VGVGPILRGVSEDRLKATEEKLDEAALLSVA
jgi:hypothetical protein